jgi:hypothetical protein
MVASLLGLRAQVRSSGRLLEASEPVWTRIDHPFVRQGARFRLAGARAQRCSAAAGPNQ